MKNVPPDVLNKDISIQDVLSQYNIIGLGIGVAIGIAGKELAFSLSNDIILPIIGGIIKTKFFSDYKFDGDKFLAKLLTFSIVFGLIILMLYFVLRPMVKKEVNTKKYHEDFLEGSLKSIITYQDEISKNTKINGRIQ